MVLVGAATASTGLILQAVTLYVTSGRKEIMEVKKCRYCGSLPEQYTHEGRNRIGEIGFVSVLKCRGCFRRVETFGSTPTGRNTLSSDVRTTSTDRLFLMLRSTQIQAQERTKKL